MSVTALERISRHVESGWFGTEPLHRIVREQATRTPDGDAYIAPAGGTGWATYDSVADELPRSSGSKLAEGEIARLAVESVVAATVRASAP